MFVVIRGLKQNIGDLYPVCDAIAMSGPSEEMDESSSEEYLSAEEGLEEGGNAQIDTGTGDECGGAAKERQSLDGRVPEEETRHDPGPVPATVDSGSVSATVDSGSVTGAQDLGPVHVTEDQDPGPLLVTEVQDRGPIPVTEDQDPGPLSVTEDQDPGPLPVTEDHDPGPVPVAQDSSPMFAQEETSVGQSSSTAALNSLSPEQPASTCPVGQIEGRSSPADPTADEGGRVESEGDQVTGRTGSAIAEGSPHSSNTVHPPSPPPTHPPSPPSAAPPPSPTPVPPPRRKRKKKCDRGSLENLAEVEDKQQLQRRSYTVCGSNPRKKDLESSMQTSVSSPESGNTPEREVVSQDGVAQDRGVAERGVTGDSNKGVPGDDVSSETVQAIHSTGQVWHSASKSQQQQQPLLLHTQVAGHDRSRSATPTPAISIQPDQYEWTSGVLSGARSEIVTSDTCLAKARGSTTSTHSVLFTSDDDSVDGVEEREGEDEGAEEREGEVEEREGTGVEVALQEETDGGTRTQSSVGAGPGAELQAEEQEGVAHHVAQGQASPVDDDKDILMSTMVKNLDTGEVIPLSAAQERIPQGHDPLTEHLLRRTEAEGNVPYEEDDASQRRRHRKTGGFKKLKWGRKKERMAEDLTTPYQEEGASEDHSTVKYKQSHRQQGKAEFEQVRLKQELKQDLTGIGMGAIWTMEFSICGRLLATAGQDGIVRVWVLTTASHFFRELQSQYQRLGVHSSVDSLSERASVASGSSRSSEEDELGKHLPFMEQPLCLYSGHTSDVLDLSWSKNFFLLSSSKDKTVRLWHISRKECLCCFQHIDIVTAIAFHPRDDRYFLSGSLDGKLRLWNIPEKRVALWNEIEGIGSRLITAANFCQNGKLAVVGTYDGRCIFYDTEHLKYHTQIHVKSRHGKNKGRKISGVEPLPGEDKLLVTSNDSRVRLYNLKEHELSCKYKGYLNSNSQIKATFSRDGQYIISGSEDNFIYIWKTHLDLNKLSSTRRDRNEFYESFSAHSASVITAVFAPVPGITVDEGIREVGEMVVAADYKGYIKVYVSGEQL